MTLEKKYQGQCLYYEMIKLSNSNKALLNDCRDENSNGFDNRNDHDDILKLLPKDPFGMNINDEDDILNLLPKDPFGMNDGGCIEDFELKNRGFEDLNHKVTDESASEDIPCEDDQSASEDFPCEDVLPFTLRELEYIEKAFGGKLPMSLMCCKDGAYEEVLTSLMELGLLDGFINTEDFMGLSYDKYQIPSNNNNVKKE
ncbi:hypothetical protein ACH5RR_014518 [Cinchona calisaya]|uniref:Uncharacterized protein n=1 Tax=Cinchona calisaya TaxID=153742 RepID=A0ABD3A329_9GENT